MSDPLATSEGKAWYQKPENVLVYGGLAVMGYFGLKVADQILPLLNRVLENGILFFGLLCVVAVGGFLLVNGDIHRLVWYGYKSAMRWVTGRFIELDPIGIMRSYVDRLMGQLKEISDSLKTLRGREVALVEKINAKTKAHDQNMNVAAQADKQGMIMQRQLAVRKAGRAEQVTLTFQGLLNEIRKQIAIAQKIQEASKYMVADINDTIEVETEKREEIQASYKAMNAARRILAKDKDREMYDRALESTTRDYANKLGEITQFLDDSRDFITTMDLENGAADEASLAKLKEWETRSANLLEGGTGKTKYRVGALKQLPSDQGSQVIDAVIDDDSKQSYSDLFSTLDKK